MKEETMRPDRQRGSALVNAMIMMLCVSVLAVGVVKFASRGAASAAADRNYAALVACADAGRQLLQAQFRMLGWPADVSPLDRSLDATSGGTMRVRSGHIGGAASVTVTGAEMLETGVLGQGRGSSGNITNVIGGLGFNTSGSVARKDVKVVVHCQQPASGDPTLGRQLEVEFGVRLN